MKKIAIAVVVLIIGFVSYYLISPIFNVQEVNDAAPVSVSTSEDTLMASGFEDLSEAQQIEMSRQMSEANELEKETMDDTAVNQNAPIASEVKSTVGHPASGVVRVFDTPAGQVIRFEDFETINGPRLHLYLSKDIEGTDYIDLGPIRGTTGNINYEVPEGIDLSEYKYVMHWCVPFNVLFNYAELL